MTVIWYLVGLVGAGSMAGFGEGHRRSRGWRWLTHPMAWSPTRRLRRWHLRSREIRVLKRWYVRVDAHEPRSRWRRHALRALLLLGPVCALAGAALLAPTAAMLLPSGLALSIAIAAAIVLVSAIIHSAAALALAANALGVAGLLVSRAGALPGPGRDPFTVALLALAGLVAVSAVAVAQREPPRAPDMAPRAGSSDELAVDELSER